MAHRHPEAEVHEAGPPAQGERQRDAGQGGDDQAGQHEAGRHLSPGDRLVGAADGAVAVGVEQVVAPADGELAGEHGQGHHDDPAGVEVGSDSEQRDHGGDRDRRAGVGRGDQAAHR